MGDQILYYQLALLDRYILVAMRSLLRGLWFLRNRMEKNGKNWNRDNDVEMHSVWSYFCETWLLIHFHTSLAIGPIYLSNQHWRSLFDNFILWPYIVSWQQKLSLVPFHQSNLRYSSVGFYFVRDPHFAPSSSWPKMIDGPLVYPQQTIQPCKILLAVLAFSIV